MKNTEPDKSKIETSIAPWLTVANSVAAVEFYKSAFEAVETYRLETPDGLVVKLAIQRAEFWVSGGNADDATWSNNANRGDSIRMILTVANPDIVFENALKAGATQVFPVGEAYGWKLGKLLDPFGFHWEIGHPIHE